MAKVKILTPHGDIVLSLYDSTPIHRDNFLKIAREGRFDGSIFHRVIKDFMIQGGELPDGSGDYTIEAEIKPELFHKRGALCAARTADQVNPERRSSGCQFYIVWGKKYSEGQIGQLEKQLQMQALQGEFDSLVGQNRDKIMQLRRNRDQASLMALQQEFEALAHAAVKEKGLGKLSEEAKKAYTTIGGTPFLDGSYTVFGEVESGLEVVGKIQEVATDASDKPRKDISFKVEVIE